MKKVSIITVCFNPIKAGRKEFFKQMIESVQKQTYSNIEHLIIDGASNDGTVEYIKKLVKNKKNIKFISEPDTGIYNAMNKGIKVSSGDYVIIMNTDDYYYTDKAIEILVNTLEKENADFSCAAYKTVNKNGTGKTIPAKPENFFCGMSFGHNTMLCKKELFEKYGMYNENYKIAADYDFVFRVMLNNVKYAISNKVVTAFRDTGVCSNDNLAEKETLAILAKYYETRLSKKLHRKITTGKVGFFRKLTIRLKVKNKVIKKLLLDKFK